MVPDPKTSYLAYGKKGGSWVPLTLERCVTCDNPSSSRSAPVGRRSENCIGDDHTEQDKNLSLQHVPRPTCSLLLQDHTAWSRSLSTSCDFSSLRGLPACAFAPDASSPTAVGRILPEPRSDQVTPNPSSKLPWLPTPSGEEPPHLSPQPCPHPTHLLQLLWTQAICFSSNKERLLFNRTFGLPREKHAGRGLLRAHYVHLQGLCGCFSDECC